MFGELGVRGGGAGGGAAAVEGVGLGRRGGRGRFVTVVSEDIPRFMELLLQLYSYPSDSTEI